MNAAEKALALDAAESTKFSDESKAARIAARNAKIDAALAAGGVTLKKSRTRKNQFMSTPSQSRTPKITVSKTTAGTPPARKSKQAPPIVTPSDATRTFCVVEGCNKVASLYSKNKELCAIHRAGGREAV